jgi:hypothetical protein
MLKSPVVRDPAGYQASVHWVREHQVGYKELPETVERGMVREKLRMGRKKLHTCCAPCC